ncbi:hypothetical protein F5148DRAFT_902127 [Russula earlei]|uniref:Uncharacterized protein n=1 Tax=Russula earlei TaxID=71964 RepID=A0ACC0ULI4_9AGAM|nr:hypothetical protein F5148DRAFT_902127 [Russula earlei]
MQSAWQPCVAEPITFSDPEPVSTGASSSNFWDVPSSDVPLPRPQEVGWPIVPSDHHDAGNSDGYSSGAFFGYDTGTDEPRPLPQPLTTFIKCALNHGQTQSAQSGFILASLNEDLVLPVPTRQFTSVDWQEFSLPDGTHYFANSTLHTITDVDLRNTEKLDAVTRFLDRCDKEDLPPPEWELWLRDGGEPTTLFIPHRAWIHHGSRMVVFERPPGISKDVDKIESEYQYWLFMGCHPLHTPLPPGSIDKAINALAWFYASPLKLSSHHRPSPFSQEECQELLTQLRSFSHTPTHSVSLVRTLVVSTTLGRIVAWRQGRRWDGATFQGPRKNDNTPSAGISLFRTASDPFFWSGLPGVPWNDHIIPVSAREVVCGVLLLVLSLSVTIALAFLIWMRDR